MIYVLNYLIMYLTIYLFQHNDLILSNLALHTLQF